MKRIVRCASPFIRIFFWRQTEGDRDGEEDGDGEVDGDREEGGDGDGDGKRGIRREVEAEIER
jgi:hypothetical protein